MIQRGFWLSCVWVFGLISLLLLCGLVYIFLHTFHYNPDRNVKTLKDPRWRVFDFNSRQVSESEIYSVAEVPVIKKVKFSDRRKLRFYFSPRIQASSWIVRSRTTGAVLSQSTLPEIQFPDSIYSDTFILEPQGVRLMKEIALTIWFAPTDKVYKDVLSWPDNYWRSYSSVPFSTKKPYSIDEWAGLSPDDPEVIEARKLMVGSVDFNAPVLERSEQVFRFVMARIVNAGGVPSDRVQAASPLETYKLFISGEGKGWCENRALVYYLFANAAGIKTRLVDIAGKFGPLKLTGHYFCESWLPEEEAWFFVDLQSSIASITDQRGRHIHSLDLKKHCDLGTCSTLTVRRYVAEADSLATDTSYDFTSLSGYLSGDIVMAYKFGYANNKSTSKVKNFIEYNTMLYAPFPLTKLSLVKHFCLKGFVVSFALTVLFFFLWLTKGHNSRRSAATP